jgi:DNA-binding XRE family transcriptional regulator
VTDPGSAGQLLDAELIRRRRLSLGITERDLARQFGVTSVVVHGIERGLNHADLTVGITVALDADALFQPAAASPATPPATTPAARGQQGTDPAPDAATVGALLHAAGRAVPVSVLAEATGWTLERVTAALAVLEAGMPSVGLRLHRLGEDRVRITGTASAPDTLHSLLRASLSRTGTNLRQAQMLYRVWPGR